MKCYNIKFIFVKRSSVYVSKNLIIYNATRKTSALISCWCGGKRRQEKSSCTHIKQRWCCSLWTKTKNLVRKLFFKKSCLNIWFFHVNPLEIFRHQDFCYKKLFWPSTVWIYCSSVLKNFANSRPSALYFKTFFLSIEQFLFSH